MHRPNCLSDFRPTLPRSRPSSLLPSSAPTNPFLGALGIAPEALFSFLDMKDANTLKFVCRLMREDVRNAFWNVKLKEMADDKKSQKVANLNVRNVFWSFKRKETARGKSQLVANLKKWRNAYPNALSAVLSKTATFPSEDFVHLRGVRYLDLNGNLSITDEAFGHFQTFKGEKGIHTLKMGGCRHITDEAFENLLGIRTLNMSRCSQLTDKAFESLRGIRNLDMRDCGQKTITDKAFENLRGIDNLNMRNCMNITDKAFENLRGIRYLDIFACMQISEKAFESLHGIHTLNMSMNFRNPSEKGFENLRGIHTLIMRRCSCFSIETAKRVLGDIPCFEAGFFDENDEEIHSRTQFGYAMGVIGALGLLQ